MLRKQASRALRHAIVLFSAVLFFFWQGPSLVRDPAHRLGDSGDSILNTWILDWDYHALTHRRNIWDTPEFYPTPNTLALSETMFGNLWLTMPVRWLSGNPVLAANLHILMAFVLCTYGTFLLTQRLTGRFLAGLAAGILFSFNPIRWNQLAHMHLLPFYWATWPCWPGTAISKPAAGGPWSPPF